MIQLHQYTPKGFKLFSNIVLCKHCGGETRYRTRYKNGRWNSRYFCGACQYKKNPYSSEYYRANREKIREYQRKYQAERKKEDPAYAERTRQSIRASRKRRQHDPLFRMKQSAKIYRQRHKKVGRQCLFCPRTDADVTFPIQNVCCSCDRKRHRNGSCSICKFPLKSKQKILFCTNGCKDSNSA
jgi:hypothetical protein